MPNNLTIPTEYRDCITGEIMENPVKVKECGHIFDAQTIANVVIANFGSNPDECVPTTCPCCRGSIEVEYLEELKSDIEKFKGEHAAELSTQELQNSPRYKRTM